MSQQTRALEVVAVGTISEEEYAYQQARRQLREAKEQCRQAVDAVQSVQASMIAAYLRECYPGKACTVTPVLSNDPNVFSMNVEIVCDPTLNEEEVYQEVQRYVDQLAEW